VSAGTLAEGPRRVTTRAISGQTKDWSGRSVSTTLESKIAFAEIGEGNPTARGQRRGRFKKTPLTMLVRRSSAPAHGQTWRGCRRDAPGLSNGVGHCRRARGPMALRGQWGGSSGRNRRAPPRLVASTFSGGAGGDRRSRGSSSSHEPGCTRAGIWHSGAASP
jgi:hypothetical protein